MGIGYRSLVVRLQITTIHDAADRYDAISRHQIVKIGAVFPFAQQDDRIDISLRLTCWRDHTSTRHTVQPLPLRSMSR